MDAVLFSFGDFWDSGEAFSRLRLGSKFDPVEIGRSSAGEALENRGLEAVPASSRDWILRNFVVYDTVVPHSALHGTSY